jgi:hypothetical protein
MSNIQKIIVHYRCFILNEDRNITANGKFNLIQQGEQSLGQIILGTVNYIKQVKDDICRQMKEKEDIDITNDDIYLELVSVEEVKSD